MRSPGRLGQLAIQATLALVGFFALLPIWNMAVLAFDGDLPTYPYELRLLPKALSFSAFAQVWSDGSQGIPYVSLLRNSLVVSGGAAVIALVFGLSMAFAFARLRFPGQRVGMLALLVGVLLPPVALMTPLYVLLGSLQVRTTQFGLMIVYAAMALPLCIWLMRSAFLAVPRDFEEAVFVEGGGLFAAFRHVTLPLAAPSIAVAVLLAFLLGYSEFALGWLFVDRADNVTLGMAMAGGDIGVASVNWGRQAALTLLMAVPVVLIFVVLRRSLLTDVRLGVARE